jgi:hypothetical protein
MSQDGNDKKNPLVPPAENPVKAPDGKPVVSQDAKNTVSPAVTLSKPPPRPPTPVAPPRDPTAPVKPATPAAAAPTQPMSSPPPLVQSSPPGRPPTPVAPPKLETTKPPQAPAPTPTVTPKSEPAPAVAPAPSKPAVVLNPVAKHAQPIQQATTPPPAAPSPAKASDPKAEEEAKRAALAAALAAIDAKKGGVPGSKFVNVFVIGTDLGFAKVIQTSLATLQTSNPGVNYRVFPGVAKDKLMDFLNKYKFHSILLEEEFTDGNPVQYLKDFKESLKKCPENVNVPIILVSSKTDLNRTKNFIKAGYKDQLIKPLDQTLFLQKMNMYNKEIKINDDTLLFSMDIAKDVDVGFYFKTRTISEYGMSVASDKSIEAGSVVTIYASFLGEHIAATVTECKKANEGHILELMFIGVTPSQTQEIRKFIRTEYAEEKNAS